MSAFVDENRNKNFCFPFWILFRKRKKVAPFEPADCTICFFSIGASRNYHYKCNHGEFCQSCIHEWSKKSNTCPICRAEPKRKRSIIKKTKRRRRHRYIRRNNDLFYH